MRRGQFRLSTSPSPVVGTRGLYVCGEIWSATSFVDATLQKYKP
jgi:hypothetical protein